MKKNLKWVAFVVAVSAVSALNVKVMLSTNHADDLAMTSLAAIGESGAWEWGESGEGWGEIGEGNQGGPQIWYQPDNVRCVYEKPNGVHVYTFKTECVFCAIPYSCTAIPCGRQ